MRGGIFLIFLRLPREQIVWRTAEKRAELFQFADVDVGELIVRELVRNPVAETVSAQKLRCIVISAKRYVMVDVEFKHNFLVYG